MEEKENPVIAELKPIWNKIDQLEEVIYRKNGSILHRLGKVEESICWLKKEYKVQLALGVITLLTLIIKILW
jgi:hypothetical protein